MNQKMLVKDSETDSMKRKAPGDFLACLFVRKESIRVTWRVNETMLIMM
jgi:hypothetical protein